MLFDLGTNNNSFLFRQGGVARLLIDPERVQVNNPFTASNNTRFGNTLDPPIHQFIGDITQSLGNITSSGFLHVSATQHTPGTDSPIVAMYDTSSGRLYYTASDAIGGGAGFPYAGSDDLTGY